MSNPTTAIPHLNPYESPSEHDFSCCTLTSESWYGVGSYILGVFCLGCLVFPGFLPDFSYLFAMAFPPANLLGIYFGSQGVRQIKRRLATHGFLLNLVMLLFVIGSFSAAWVFTSC